MTEAAKKKITGKNKTKPTLLIRRGKVFIQATFNNTVITFTDFGGNTICWGSAGSVGFKGTRKHTPFAATTALEAVAKKAKNLGVRELEVYVKGPGSGRDAALRALKTSGFKMDLIADITPIPHNGPRARKRRRV
ncbi:MAG TPA: 30S ribosomal protein S11 [Candidatus Bathyarchaeia archaeon]|nr:30S ribosomal protein S11 [Candidatus Bathyarchaeia archaeon]